MRFAGIQKNDAETVLSNRLRTFLLSIWTASIKIY